MQEQATKEVQADTVLKEALQESQILNIRLRTIEVKLENEIDALNANWLTPKSAQKAASLSVAKELVSKVMRDGEEEQEKFKREIGEGKHVSRK